MPRAAQQKRLAFASAMESDINNEDDAVIISRDDISDYNPEQILPESPETIQKIRSWLQPTSYDIAGGEYRKHLASHVAGTGAWLTSSDKYNDWLKSTEHGMLWIKGIPGSGKSVMVANLIDEITKSNPGSPVLFFFFRQIIAANHEPAALLRDWMDQVLDYSPPLQKQLNTYLKTNRSIESMAIEDMWKDLKIAFAGLPEKVFCVVDALDEMDQGHDTFLEALGSLGQWRPGKESLVDVDISTFVKFALSNSTIPQSEWQIIEDAVPGRANGLFIYAKLAMDAFLEPGADINAVLSQLPTDLNVLYTDLLKEHAQRSGVAADIQHLILQSVTHASRPLRLLELAEMIKVVSPDGFTRDLKTTKDLIRAACGPLLEILADETVSVIHHSFTEYLKGTTRSGDSPGYSILRMGSTHAQLALACLRYLRAGCLDAVEVNIMGIDDDDDDPSEAARHDQTEVNTELRKFLGDTRNLNAWIQIKWPGGERTGGLITQVLVAAKVGLVSYSKELLENMEVDAQDIAGKTPLYWAASEGHAEVMRVLISAGANPDQDDNISGLKPLHVAAMHNRHEAVTVLLEAGVSPLTGKTREDPGRRCGNAPTSTGQTPLMYACHAGHLEAVEAFLPFLKDMGTVQRALVWAAETGRSAVVTRILQHPGVDVNAKVFGDTPLFFACGYSDVATITALLQAGADPNTSCSGSGSHVNYMHLPVPYLATNGTKLNCLHRLCGLSTKGNYHRKGEAEDLQRIFSLLVQAGIDINQRAPSGQTALHGAISSPVLTRLLLDAGADANATDSKGSAPLHKVECLDSMVLLIEHGHADINIEQADGLTPLICLLSEFRQNELILKFLEYGPNCNALDKNGNGVLHIALKRSYSSLQLIKTLLKAGADPNMKNRDGLVPLLAIGDDSSSIIDGIISLVLEAGADINATDRNGATLLVRLLNSRPRHKEDPNKVLIDLIDRGASTSVRDFNGGTLLHQAVMSHDISAAYNSNKSNPTRLDFLIGLGLDVKAVDYRGNGLLHQLALRRCSYDSSLNTETISFWEDLISMGLDLEQKNHAGRTPLHILCAKHTHSIRYRQGEVLPIDFILSRTKNLDNVDNKGNTPLHLAVTGGQLHTKKLLDAGANPAAITNEGLTPLHLASRCRESNVVGLLLDALRNKKTSGISSNLSQLLESDIAPSIDTRPQLEPVIGVNAVASGITPLFYACRSGRPETVALLLEAGADVKTGDIFQAFGGFEEEDGFWKSPRQSADGDGNGGAIALTLHDTSRRVIQIPHNQSQSELIGNETTRIEEILDMLVKYGADLDQLRGGILKRDPFASGIQGNRDYTDACLREIWEKNGSEPPTKQHSSNTAKFSKLMDHSLREASIQTLKDFELIESGASNQWILRRFLVRREYHLVEELFHLGVDFLPIPGQNKTCNFAVLVRHGFASLADKIGTLEAELKLEKGDWHAFMDKTRPGLSLSRKDLSGIKNIGNNPVPFLLEAVRRELPNMDVVRLLVEKFGVDIDELYYVEKHVDRTLKPVATDSALHYVAQGKFWWHVHQALPYLLEAGADVRIRNYKGQTPLHTALEKNECYSHLFYRDAAEKLIAAGADVNAVEEGGHSCLAYARNDIIMIRLLKAHGATVTADAIFAAIDANNVDGLKELLSGGVDANMRRKPLEKSAGKRSHRSRWGRLDDLEPHEEFPLYLAAYSFQLSSNSSRQDMQGFEGVSPVQVLLDHGADPFAKFLREDGQLASASGKTNVAADTPSIKVPQGYEECTVLHALMLDGRRVDSVDTFLRFPGLDVNHRDAKGRTLLHAACENSRGPDAFIRPDKDIAGQSENVTVFQCLVSLGAELDARDNFSRNVLHCMTDVHGYIDHFENSFAYVVENVPHLINQADNDGMTPLHYTIAHASKHKKTHLVQLLLSAGADYLAVNKNGDTVLHILARKLKSPALRDLFKDLVRRGVDVNARNAQGETPLFAFCSRRRKEKSIRPSFSQFFNKGEEDTEKDAKEVLEKLGADFFARDAKGRGLMHVAASGDVTRFKELMDMGLDVMLEDDAQQTAIDVAAACGNEEVLGLFEKKN
ncbi:hypothetical protein G7Z17_g762 [Cylindrodendrum hubeiense]|uniref:NACHT domain-containing protein n=1 Tax=Cylindrodendrum hubeiense TaxID=595255 RepID=A0A9P5HRB0_9HYPO|nr:hypothetical protein G7Z17_g762 [Cylindrodendrum hubeiense]